MAEPASRDQVLATIREIASQTSRALVAIGGHGGAGKTTLAEWLAPQLLSATVVHLDDFARPGADGFDLQRSIEQLIRPLATGTQIRYQRWDWATNRAAEWRDVENTNVVIVEGVAAFAQAYGDIWHLRVWVEAPFAVRLHRGVSRDGEGSRSMWIDVWEPEENAYIEREHPDLAADVVVDGTE